MAVFDPTPPKFDLTYNAGKTDIGAGYASGITEAGKAIGGAISGVSSLMQQRQDATDTLNAMHGSGMLSDDQYKAIAGKSLGAQQSMIACTRLHGLPNKLRPAKWQRWDMVRTWIFGNNTRHCWTNLL